jgi:hypothetical protein
MKNNSTSHKALGRSFKRAALKETDDDPSWDENKVLGKLKEARAAPKLAQKKHRENRDAGLQLKEQEEKVRDADEPKAAKKVAVAVEALIQKHRTQESYTRIKNVMQPLSGGG